MTVRYAVFGNPINHSKSPSIHRAFAQQRGESLTYERIGPAVEDFEQAVNEFFADQGAGANITVPFKERAYAMCTVLTDRAEQAQAVNTLWMKNGQLHGDNTDGAGLLGDMIRNLNWKLVNKRVLLLGAGGAARGVLGCLLAAGTEEVVVANRTASKAQTLAEQFSEQGNVRAVSLDELAEEQPFKVIVNATAASLSGKSLALPASLLAPSAKCYDMMYGDTLSPFLLWAQDNGAELADGLGMLVEQAAESFYRWHGWRPSTLEVIDSVRRLLESA